MAKEPFSMHVDVDDFIPATDAEKEYLVQMLSLIHISEPTRP